MALRLDQVEISPEKVTLLVTSTQPVVCSPCCGQQASRIQSRYVRRLADFPWGSFQVVVHVTVRRFFCDNAACFRKILVERLSGTAQAWARRTNRLRDLLLALVMSLGAEASVQYCLHWKVRLCADTLLHLLRRTPLPARPTPRVLGVDDWSFRRKQGGTILVDLEKHQPIDLLADTSEEILTQWLRAHPGVKIISRDRGAAFAKGATLGAGKAMQIVDRWHLLKNLGEALQKLMARHSAALKQAAREAEPDPITPIVQKESLPLVAGRRKKTTSSAQLALSNRRAWQEAMHQQVQALCAQGDTFRAIAKQLKMNTHTVSK